MILISVFCFSRVKTNKKKIDLQPFESANFRREINHFILY
jgi:hypothetical protein